MFMSGKDKAGKMTPSKENYLKAILKLSKDEGARSVDIANDLGVSKASVSSMMNVLQNDGYVAKEKYGVITLTENGEKTAVKIKRRYETIRLFLQNVLDIDAETAAKDACRIEHLISSQTADRINRHIEELSGYK
jgi:DtxR family Mn-dependent transcriptional regulator